MGEFGDAIGVYDSEHMVLLRVWDFPCKCFGLERNQPDPAGTDNLVCAAPHTAVEDGAGNLYITMKLGGGIAVLQNQLKKVYLPERLDNDQWAYFPIPRNVTKPLPFYIIRSVVDVQVGPYTSANSLCEEYVYFNSVTTAEIGFFNTTGGKFPPGVPTMIDVSVGVPPDPKSSNSGKYGAETRPGGLVPTMNGGALATAYNAYGMLLSVDQYSNFLPLMLPNTDLAYLHICVNEGIGFDGHYSQDLMLLASSNDFPETCMPYDLPDPPPVNPDVLTVLRDVRLRTMEGLMKIDCAAARSEIACNANQSCRWFNKECWNTLQYATRQDFKAPSQNSWFHRVLCTKPGGSIAKVVDRTAPKRMTVLQDEGIDHHYISGPMVFATELRTDRLFLLQQVNVIPPILHDSALNGL